MVCLDQSLEVFGTRIPWLNHQFQFCSSIFSRTRRTNRKNLLVFKNGFITSAGNSKQKFLGVYYCMTEN